MKRCPKIGARVRFIGNIAIGPCVGTVTEIFPVHEWDEIREREGERLPESDWHVGMTPDALPNPWPYSPRNEFAPCVGDLRRIRKALQP